MCTHTCKHTHIYKKRRGGGRNERREGEVGRRVKLDVQQRTGYILRHGSWWLLRAFSLLWPGGRRQEAHRKEIRNILPPHPCWMRSPLCLPFPSFARELNVYTAWLASMLAGDSRPCWGTEPGSMRPVPICPHPPALLARYRQVWASAGQERPGDLGQCCCFLGPSM